ncbi:unnamed protein product [Pleuronectes platessa]|uniref:Uncharacterized protein n=1 Tax=Pleuronectes platessa TaxID=8262 RepID=A0A9N7TUQ3_PLEPL|nr:unnamed protein product [Pleuronectes platessa]
MDPHSQAECFCLLLSPLDVNLSVCPRELLIKLAYPATKYQCTPPRVGDSCVHRGTLTEECDGRGWGGGGGGGGGGIKLPPPISHRGGAVWAADTSRFPRTTRPIPHARPLSATGDSDGGTLLLHWATELSPSPGTLTLGPTSDSDGGAGKAFRFSRLSAEPEVRAAPATVPRSPAAARLVISDPCYSIMGVKEEDQRRLFFRPKQNPHLLSQPPALGPTATCCQAYVRCQFGSPAAVGREREGESGRERDEPWAGEAEQGGSRMGWPVIEHFLCVPRHTPLSAAPLTPNLSDNHMEDYLQRVSADVTGTASR